MSKILVPQRRIWTKQPQLLCPLESRIAPHAYFLPVNGKESPIIEAGASIGANSVGAINAVVAKELGLAFTSNSTATFIEQQLKNPLVNVGEVSFLSVLRPLNTNDTTVFAAALTTTSGTTPLIGLGQGSITRTLQFLVRTDAGAVESTLLTPPAGVWANGKSVTVVGTHSAAGGFHRIYINGVRYQDVASTLAGTTTTNRFNIGGLRRSTSSAAITANHYLAAFWKRALTDEEAIAISGNPWQIFAKKKRYSFASISSAPTHDLVGANSTQANTSSTEVISQVHSLTAANSVQGNTSSDGVVTQAQLLAVANSTQANLSSSVALGGGTAHNLVAANSTQAALSSSVTVTQLHQLVVASSAQANKSSSVSLPTSGGTVNIDEIIMTLVKHPKFLGLLEVMMS